MVCKLDIQIITSEFESRWVPHSYSLVPNLSKKKRLLIVILEKKSSDSAS